MNYHSQQYYVELDPSDFIEANLDALRDIHAKNYMGTDDDMSDAFNRWVVNFSVEELSGMIDAKKVLY